MKSMMTKRGMEINCAFYLNVRFAIRCKSSTQQGFIGQSLLVYLCILLVK